MNIRKLDNDSNVTKKDIRQDIEKNPVKFLNKKLTGSKYDFGVNNIFTYGYYLEQGWIYDFKDTLKKYVYRQYGQWYQGYALNRANLRKLAGGRIIEILESNK